MKIQRENLHFLLKFTILCTFKVKLLHFRSEYANLGREGIRCYLDYTLQGKRESGFSGGCPPPKDHQYKKNLPNCPGYDHSSPYGGKIEARGFNAESGEQCRRKYVKLHSEQTGAGIFLRSNEHELTREEEIFEAIIINNQISVQSEQILTIQRTDRQKQYRPQTKTRAFLSKTIKKFGPKKFLVFLKILAKPFF